MTPPPFAASLRWHREQAGLTLTALARESGVDPSHLSRCEGGRVHRPGEGTLRALADALGIPAERLLEPPPEDRALPPAPGGTAEPCPCVPPAPVAAGQGDRPPAESVLEAARLAGPQTPETAMVGEGRERSPGSTLAERQAEQRKAIKAARSALAKDRRNQRARPWQKRDPYSRAVPGVRKLPPGGEA